MDNSPVTIAKNLLSQNKATYDNFILWWYWGNFYKFEDGHYQDKKEDEVKGDLYDYLEGKSYLTKRGERKTYKATAAKVRSILKECKKLCHFDGTAPVWFGEKENAPDPCKLLAFRNGILDIDKYVKDEIELYPSTPSFFTVNALPYDFDENADSELWNDYLEDTFNGDQKKIQLLSEWMGYNCVPDTSHNNLTLLIGPTQSGKSTVAWTMAEMLGPNNCAPFEFGNVRTFDFLAKGILSAIGMVGSPVRAKSQVENMLHVLKGDAIDVKPKYRPQLSAKFPCRFTFMAYDPSVFGKYEQEIRDQANILTFPNSYLGRQNYTLKDQLIKEAKSGKLINFALRGLKSLYQNQGFITPQ
jgi:putative DNA primase/helicase